MLRFQAGESDIISRVGARNFAVLEKDRGAPRLRTGELPAPAWNTTFCSSTWGPARRNSPEIAARQAFLRRKSFRQAVSAAIDRDAMVRLVYLGTRGAAGRSGAAGQQGVGQTALPAPVRSLERARQLLAADGFQWNATAACWTRREAGGVLHPRPATATPNGSRWRR